MSVAKVQVGLLGSARGLQRDLERIAKRSDTSTSEGLAYVLQGVPCCCSWVRGMGTCVIVLSPCILFLGTM